VCAPHHPSVPLVFCAERVTAISGMRTLIRGYETVVNGHGGKQHATAAHMESWLELLERASGCAVSIHVVAIRRVIHLVPWLDADTTSELGGVPCTRNLSRRLAPELLATTALILVEEVADGRDDCRNDYESHDRATATAVGGVLCRNHARHIWRRRR